MRLIKIGLANVDTTVGAFRSNTDAVRQVARILTEQQCTVGCFPEQVFSGYPAEDLVQWRGFVAKQWAMLQEFRCATAAARPMFPAVFVVGLTVEYSGHLYNSAAVVCRGKVLGIVPKEKLPTYGVFYERRTFSGGIPGYVFEVKGVPFGDLIFRFPFGTMAVEVCEDIWSPDGPMKRRAYSGAELVVNISASPWRAGVVATRREIISTRAADNCAAVVYVNQVGGNDGLVFDGGGFVNQCGRMVFEAPRWRAGHATAVVDLDRVTRLRHENTTWRADCEAFLRENNAMREVLCYSGPAHDNRLPYPVPATKSFFLPPDVAPVNPRVEYFDDLIEAMVSGLAGYFEKTGAFKRIGIALSGGRDSALALVIAWLYAKRKFAGVEGVAERLQTIHDFIHCFSLPTEYNSPRTREAARRLTDHLGVTFLEIPIDDVCRSEAKLLAEALGRWREIPALARQNIQARVRGEFMWNWTNSAYGLWIQTGNMSEKAVGYTTIGGDMMGAFSLLANLPKTVVEELIKYARDVYGISALDRVLAEKPTAGLSFGQEDEKDLMPSLVLDVCYALFAGEKMMPAEVYRVVRSMWSDEELKSMLPDYAPGMLKEWVRKFAKLFRASIFKWVQAPEAVHLGSLDLDRERALQLPVVQSPEWLALEELDALPD